MGLKTVLPGEHGAVVGDRHRQEMELDVGVSHALARPDEAAGLEMVGGAEAAPAGAPGEADQPSRKEPGMAIERDRLFRGDLESELEMVLQVFADPRTLGDDLNAERAQFRRRPDAGQFQQLRRIDRSAAKNHLAPGPRHELAPRPPIMNPDREAAVEGDPRCERMGDDAEFGRFIAGLK